MCPLTQDIIGEDCIGLFNDGLHFTSLQKDVVNLVCHFSNNLLLLQLLVHIVLDLHHELDLGLATNTLLGHASFNGLIELTMLTFLFDALCFAFRSCLILFFLLSHGQDGCKWVC